MRAERLTSMKSMVELTYYPFVEVDARIEARMKILSD